MNPEVFAQVVRERQNCAENERNPNCLSVLPEVTASSNQLQTILAVAFGIFATVAVVVIIIAAIDFANSGGNPDSISRAKKTIIYALIGLIIALSAEAIVLTLLGRL